MTHGGLTFIDPDMPPITPAVQAAMMRLINDDTLGALDLSEIATVVAAANQEPQDLFVLRDTDSSTACRDTGEFYGRPGSGHTLAVQMPQPVIQHGDFFYHGR